MSYEIINDDITKVAADAIVNSANPDPICGGSTEALIYDAAGYDELLEARQKIGPLDLCEARHTPAFGLKAKYIIHVSAPRWMDGTANEEAMLASCYRNALEEAYNLGCKSIAFPLLSTGVYHFPKDKAMLIATETMEEFQKAGSDAGKPDRVSMDIKLVLYDAESVQISQELFSQAQKFVDEHYVPELPPVQNIEKEVLLAPRSKDFALEDRQLHNRDFENFAFQKQNWEEIFNKRNSIQESQSAIEAPTPAKGKIAKPRKSTKKKTQRLAGAELTDESPIICKSAKDTQPVKLSVVEDINHASHVAQAQTVEDIKKGLNDLFIGPEVGMTFRDKVFEIINKKGLQSKQVQHDADIDRRLFSKILHKDYQTSKPTAIALAIGLKLNYQESKDFLALAGFALSPASKTDLIVRFFMENKEYFYKENHDRDKYKVFFLNDFLIRFGQETLGSGRKL